MFFNNRVSLYSYSLWESLCLGVQLKFKNLPNEDIVGQFFDLLDSIGQNLNQIWVKLSQIRYTKIKPDFKPEFGQIRTQIIKSKTTLKEFKTNPIQIRPSRWLLVKTVNLQ